MAAQFGCGRRSLAATAGGGNNWRSRAPSVMPSGSGQLRPARRARRIHSPAAVALTPRLPAILRLDMPAAESLSKSRILRIGNLGPGIGPPLPCGKGAKPCRFADYPTAPVTPVHRLVAINRSTWSQSIVIAGRDHPLRAYSLKDSISPTLKSIPINWHEQERFFSAAVD